MAELKIATFNLEWMISIFGAESKQWKRPGIPKVFKGKRLGDIRLEPIPDVHALCERIAGVIKEVDAKIWGLQEGPPLKEQLEEFVDEFLGGEYVVHHSNENQQSICALVRNTMADQVDEVQADVLRQDGFYYPWGTYLASDRKKHHFDRIPLVLKFRPAGGNELTLAVVHTKSKISPLDKAKWEARDKNAIFAALEARQKLSVEASILRKYIDQVLHGPAVDYPLVLIGDCNDGPEKDLFEEEFLIHEIVDELCGTLLDPEALLDHAMEPVMLATAASIYFADPTAGGKLTGELVDHILVSPGIWQKKSAFRVKPGSCQVETAAYNKYNQDLNPSHPQRGLRPSDHRPVSAILEYV